MKTYSFTVDLSRDLTDAEVDQLFEAFQGNVCSGVTVGQARLSSDVKAESLDAAVIAVVDFATGLCIEVQRVELEQAEIAVLKAA